MRGALFSAGKCGRVRVMVGGSYSNSSLLYDVSAISPKTRWIAYPTASLNACVAQFNELLFYQFVFSQQNVSSLFELLGKVQMSGFSKDLSMDRME